MQLYQMTCCIVHNCMIYPQNEWANAFSNFQHHWMTCCIVHSCAFSLQCLRWPDPSKDLLHCANLFILSPEWSSLWWFRLPALSNLHLPHLKRFFPLLSSHDLVYHQRHSSSSFTRPWPLSAVWRLLITWFIRVPLSVFGHESPEFAISKEPGEL